MKNPSGCTKAIGIFCALLFIPVLMFLLCPVLNNIQHKRYINRIRQIAAPKKTKEVGTYKHLGMTCYNSDYCHFIFGTLYVTELSQQEIEKHYSNISIKGVGKEPEKIKVAFFNTDTAKFVSASDQEQYFLDNYLNKELKENFSSTVDNALRKKAIGKKNSQSIVFVYAESMELWTICSTFDTRCL